MSPNANFTVLNPVKYIALFLLLVASNDSFSNQYIDSLIKVFDQTEKTVDKANLQEQMGNYYMKSFAFENAVEAFKTALSYVPKTDWLRKANLAESLGTAYIEMEYMQNATLSLKRALFFYKKGKADPSVIAMVTMNVGRTFYDVSQYDSAMTYYITAQKLYEENKIYDQGYGYLLHYIGSIFKRQDNLEKACEYYTKEVEYGRKLGFKKIEAEGLYLAAICLESDSAMLSSDLRSVQLYKEIGDTGMLGLIYSLLGQDYNNLGLHDSALYYEKKCLEIFRTRNEVSQIAGILIEIGWTLVEMKRYADAQPYLNEAEEYIKKTGVKKYVRLGHLHECYFNLYYDQGNYKKAVEALDLMYLYKDSVRYADQENSIQEMEIKYETEKKETQLILLEKDKNLAQKEKLLAQESAEHEANFGRVMMFSGLLLLIAGVFVFVKYRESQKQKIIISEQKKETQMQKEIVEEKNKNITDSIVYASSIQKAISTSREYISKMFSDYFILNKPKDIVSGDFYWAYQTADGKKFIAIGDCTGHGVPGAMMSILGNTFLNELIIESGHTEPNIILNKLRDQVKRALSNNISKDGMDMALCCIEGNSVKFSGANLPIYVISDNELEVLKGNKQPIGLQPGIERPFEQTEFTAKPGTRIFLFSDGFADQFGGKFGKKYKYQTFRDKLISLVNLPMKDYEHALDLEFEIWKDNLEQVDDVCVMGVLI